MFFMTVSGSTYEVDSESKRIRRVKGVTTTTRRVGSGEWRDYDKIDGPEVGRPVIIFWTASIDPPPAEGTIPTTMTSLVTQVLEDNGTD
jgi:hypothetical protein